MSGILAARRILAMASSASEEEGVRELVFLQHTLKFSIDWQCGIGGEFWTTGIDLCRHFEEHEAFYRGLFKGRRVLELGSGTGLVGLCAAFLGASETILTDTASHLPILEQNLAANRGLYDSEKACTVKEYDWSLSADHLGPAPFDVVLGTDLAYAPELYDPLIKAYSTLAGPQTVIILGVTRSDTGPPFFAKLQAAGFDYCLIGGNKALEKGGGNFVLLSIVDRRAGQSRQ